MALPKHCYGSALPLNSAMAMGMTTTREPHPRRVSRDAGGWTAMPQMVYDHNYILFCLPGGAGKLSGAMRQTITPQGGVQPTRMNSMLRPSQQQLLTQGAPRSYS